LPIVKVVEWPFSKGIHFPNRWKPILVMSENARHWKEKLTSLLLWITGLCAFAPLSVIVVLLSFLADPRQFSGFTKWACRIVLRCLRVRVAVQGIDQIQKDQVYLFVCNHVNILDVLVLYGHIPHYFRGVELDEHFGWFFYGLVIRRLGMIPISQTHGRSALQSLKQAQQVMTGGTSILILPEGGRTLDGHMQPFKRGAFVLAKKAGVAVVPMVMTGAFEIMRKGSLLIRPGKMILKFGAPIACEQIKALGAQAIESRVRGQMQSLFNA
jgi:1-acyl-sn-glycerol-3-phosphate acyltransferase